MTIKAILFDVDGTLVDSNDLHAQAWTKAFAEFGHLISLEDVRGRIGMGGDNLMPALIGAKAVDEDGPAISAARGRIYSASYARRVTPFADVAALFRRAKQDGWMIVIATSGDSREIEPHLDMLGVRSLVDAVTTAGDAERSKPNPDIFAAALLKVGAHAKDAIVVGDSPYDIGAASQLGIRTLAVRTGGFSDRILREAGASALYDSPADLLARYDGSLLAIH
ncbi:HAD family hydrolase [Aureimonas sp. AU4]|uniref:HAD family hydrolase n=1 Tax=Aureimonas sp. AU4 TaxID=1638163 RepID=UPI00078088D4|nr:HAD family hydrolase [Aureimonas sp. AU4]